MILLILSALTGTVVGVHDGDTFRLDNGARIRLQAIDANERDGSCHATCAPMSAKAATDNLSRLALGKRVACEPTGKSYNRVVAWCSVGRVDLSCEQLRAGAAVYVARYDPKQRLVGCEGR
jgi:endonuclease YncB( thermonuclease family)